MNVLKEARTHLVDFLRGKSNAYETRHPWRKSWEFAVLHSLRVENYALEILERERHDLTEDEVVLLRLAAILHDIGRLERTDNHAELGRQIVRAWLQDRPEVVRGISDTERLLELIGDHSNKGNSETDFSKAVLKDADMLDEIGVMSIFMAMNWVDRESPFFFHQLKRRLIDFELPFCEQMAGMLSTQGAREILEERRAFVAKLIAQLVDELECDTFAEQVFDL